MVFSELLHLEPGFIMVSSGPALHSRREYFALPDHRAITYWATLQYQFPHAVADTLHNPNLKPSLGYGLEVGLDMKFLQDRVGFSLPGTSQNNKDAVLGPQRPGASGYTNR